jgi:hypothetical protein
MRSSSLIVLGFATIALANLNDILTEASLPAIKATIQVVDRDATALDASIAALTAENVNTQLGTINKNLLTLSSDLSAQAKKIGASGALGIMEIAGLLSTKNSQEWIALATKLNATAFSTYGHIVAKKDIVKASGQVDKIVPGIKSQKQGILDIIAIVPGQVPSVVKGQLNSLAAKMVPAAAGATGKPASIDDLMAGPAAIESIGKVIDEVLNQIIGVIKGTQETFTLPAGFELPAGLTLPTGLPQGGLSGADVPAAVPAAPTATPKASSPKASSPKASLPKASPSRGSLTKGIPKGKGTSPE